MPQQQSKRKARAKMNDGKKCRLPAGNYGSAGAEMGNTCQGCYPMLCPAE